MTTGYSGKHAIYELQGLGHQPKRAWPDPDMTMLGTPEFEAVWQAIKNWDIHVPGAYTGYCGATGNHVRAILDALKNSK